MSATCHSKHQLNRKAGQFALANKNINLSLYSEGISISLMMASLSKLGSLMTKHVLIYFYWVCKSRQRVGKEQALYMFSNGYNFPRIVSTVLF